MSAVNPVVDPFGAAEAAAATLAAATGTERHDLAIVLGSGWRTAADRMGELVAEVAIDEAVELSKRYASPEAAKLVNGVLGAYVREGKT